MKLSIVTSMYMSSSYLKEFCDRCRSVAELLVGNDYQIILVNDGSPDDSREVALDLLSQNSQIAVVDLSRNFGHHKAMMVGLRYATGEKVFLLDCDLEEPPEILSDWWNRLDTDPDLDVIYGAQPLRKGRWFERLTGWFFYKIINALSVTKLTANAMVARLMTKRYVQALVAHKDREIYLFGLMAITGFRQEAQLIPKSDKGSSSYTTFRKVSLFFNAITSFTNFPLYLIFYIGMLISLTAFIWIGYLVGHALLSSAPRFPGWTSLLVSVWCVGGLTLTALGVIGIYLAKIFTETKERPFVIIKDVFGNITHPGDSKY